MPDELLEIRAACGAFEQVEEWLRERGFFAPGGEELVADVFLGYGLSQPLRRGGTAPAPDPCPALPLAACAVRGETYHVVHAENETPLAPTPPDVANGSFTVGEWSATWSSEEYADAVAEVRAAIAAGDVYQVNLVQHLAAPFEGSVGAVAARLRDLEPRAPGPFLTDDWAIASASPELFLARRGNRVWTMPIKGTRPLGERAELGASTKDAAEHIMIVDLERNDLSRVCLPGSVRWPELLVPSTLAGVEHLVSTVEGTLEGDVGFAEILRATFPGGSVTGAPKIAALDIIAGLEPVGRGASMGALGWVRGNGDFELALTIRTVAIADGRIHLWVGGGVVWDSDAYAEVRESWTKAAPVLAALEAPVRETVAP